MRCTMRASLAVQVLLAALITQSMAQPESGLPFGPVFSESQYDTREGMQLAVRLSASILSHSAVSTASGSIEVDIIVESPPSGGSQQHAERGADYIVNTQDTQSKIFTVTFQSKQSLSSAHVIQIVDDLILEGREYFLLRINAVRYFGQLGEALRTQEALSKTSVLVSIEDDDYVQVHWSMPQISSTEGDEVKLRAVAIGTYAIPIAIGVTAIGTGVQPAISGKDFSFTRGAKLHFSDINTNSSFSDDELVIQIIDDDIAEPRESFICNLQGDSLNAVQVTSPFQATIEIKDNDELVLHWAKDFYEFTEGDLLTEVELVTDSDIEVDQVSISGLPRQIPNEHMTHIAPILVPGPSIPGFTFDVSIERVKFRGAVYGNAQVTQAGRADVQRATSEFVFTPVAKSAFQNFTIVDDNVLEFDELFTAELDLGTELANWNVRIEEPSVLYCLIRDNDFVEVSFSEEGYTVNESEGQVTITLRITGKFFIPVYAIIEVTDGTATDPEDYSGARRYNVTFPLTAYTDQDDPESSAISDPISFKITKDVTVLEDVEYFQARIVETSSESQVKIAQPNTVNITIIEDKTKAIAVTPDMTLVGRVTETLKIECRAKVNLDDTNVTFVWKTDDDMEDTTTAQATNGMATYSLLICELNLEKHHDKLLECHPSNSFGEYNFTSYRIVVELFPSPNVTKFAFQPDRKDAIDVEWLPIKKATRLFVPMEEYYIELARDKDGSDIEASYTVTGGKVSHTFSAVECSNRYWVRIKAVTRGNQDISSFSGWVPIEPVSCPLITTSVPDDMLPGWVIFLIILAVLLVCGLALIFLCCLLCCAKMKKPKGEYRAEKREKAYQQQQADSPESHSEQGSVASGDCAPPAGQDGGETPL